MTRLRLVGKEYLTMRRQEITQANGITTIHAHLSSQLDVMLKATPKTAAPSFTLGCREQNWRFLASTKTRINTLITHCFFLHPNHGN